MPKKTSSFILISLLFVGFGVGFSATESRVEPGSSDRTVQLIDFLEASGRMKGADLHISVKDHIAELSGTVECIDQAEWAAAVVFATDDVFGAIQKIEIRSELYDRKSAEDELQHMFSHSPALKGSGLHARAMERGRIVIVGQAGRFDEIELAREFASRIAGVLSIDVQAAINPMLPRPESAITAQLDFQLQDDPLLAHLPVRFSLREGELTVSGTVPDADLRERLLLKSMIGGVRSLKSFGLRIDPALGLSGMSDKRYHPEESLRVLELVYRRDYRIQGATFELKLENGRIRVLSPSLSPGVARAMIENSRGLPGVMGVSTPAALTTAAAPGIRYP